MTEVDTPAREAYVWIWLPDATAPVVAGRLDLAGERVLFTYARSYLESDGAISLFAPELPLEPGPQAPQNGDIASCIADAAPDGWGRRVIENARASRGPGFDLGTLDYLVRAGGDRIGALEILSSGHDYEPSVRTHATVEELATSAERVEAGIPLSWELDRALLHGSSIGGARPKALLRDGDRALIAKFSSTDDPYSVVGGEFVAMELARRCGLDVAPVSLTTALGKRVLLVERFDRPRTGGRRAVVSALTILGLGEMDGWYATYWELADQVRLGFSDPGPTLKEVFRRITFNILVGNTDDHARNHAAFWDGRQLTLTPAYDICPQLRDGGEAAQAMAIAPDGFRMAQVAGCVERSDVYLLDRAEAREIVERQLDVITSDWSDVCELAELTEVDRQRFWQRQFLNPYALEGF